MAAFSGHVGTCDSHNHLVCKHLVAFWRFKATLGERIFRKSFASLMSNTGNSGRLPMGECRLYHSSVCHENGPATARTARGHGSNLTRRSEQWLF